MGKSHKQIVLMRSKYTKRAWLTDVEGNRLTPKFKIISKINTGRFVTLYTSKGVIIYHRHQAQLLYNGLGVDVSANVPSLEKISENIYAIKFSSSKRTLYNKEGDKLYDKDFEMVITTNTNGIIVRQNGLWGLIDENLNWIFEPIFSSISEFNEQGYAVVGLEKGTKVAVVDKYGNYVVEPLAYDAARFLTSDMLMVISNGKHGVLTLNGDVIVPVEYDHITLKHGYFIVQVSGKHGIVDINGNIVFKCIYSAVVETKDKFIVRGIEGLGILEFKQV